VKLHNPLRRPFSLGHCVRAFEACVRPTSVKAPIPCLRSGLSGAFVYKMAFVFGCGYVQCTPVAARRTLRTTAAPCALHPPHPASCLPSASTSTAPHRRAPSVPLGTLVSTTRVLWRRVGGSRCARRLGVPAPQDQRPPPAPPTAGVSTSGLPSSPHPSVHPCAWWLWGTFGRGCGRPEGAWHDARPSAAPTSPDPKRPPPCLPPVPAPRGPASRLESGMV